MVTSAASGDVLMPRLDGVHFDRHPARRAAPTVSLQVRHYVTRRGVVRLAADGVFDRHQDATAPASR